MKFDNICSLFFCLFLVKDEYELKSDNLDKYKQ